MNKSLSILKTFLVIAVTFAFFSSCSKSDFGGVSSSYDSTSSGGENGGVQAGGQAGVITAGEWKDLDNWEFWLQIMRNPDWQKMKDYWSFYPDQRYSVLLQNSENQVVNDASVVLKDSQGNTLWEAHTDNIGAAELWTNLYGTSSEAAYIEVHHQNETFKFEDIYAIDEGKMELKINTPNLLGNSLDISFVVDATGSMGDEMEFLKVELLDVLNRVKEDHANIDLKVGATFYQDEGDKFLTRDFPLTSDISSLMSNIGDQSAGGGGDYPEAVEKGLASALYQNQWSETAAARLMFLLLDAPPHHTAEVTNELQQIIEDAAAKGIKVIPITASGIDKETEFLMRFLAISTNGTYVFITNHSGVGNDHIEPTIGQYEVEKLNDLLVRLIGGYIQ